jgi:pyruvate dehydrogenase kinase 2/3/4
MRLTPAVRNLNRLLDLKSMKMLDHYSQFNPSPLTINQFMEFGQKGTEEDSFTFLRKEIPVRLSNIMKEINLLPFNLLQMPSTLTLQARMIKHCRISG